MFLLKLPFGGTVYPFTNTQNPISLGYIYIYISHQISLFSQLNHHYWWLYKPQSFNIVFHHVFNLFVTKISSASITETSLLEVVGAHSSLWHFLLRQNNSVNSGLAQQNLGFCHLSVVDSKNIQLFIIVYLPTKNILELAILTKKKSGFHAKFNEQTHWELLFFSTTWMDIWYVAPRSGCRHIRYRIRPGEQAIFSPKMSCWKLWNPIGSSSQSQLVPNLMVV